MSVNLVIVSNHIFSKGKVFSGAISIKDGLIVSVDNEIDSKLIDENTKIIRCGDKWVTPGLVDNHCFFSGDLMLHSGVDFKDCNNSKDLVDKLVLSKKIFNLHLGWNLSTSMMNSNFDCLFKGIKAPILLRGEDEEKVYINDEAKKLLDWDGKDLSSEAQWKLIDFILMDKEYSKSAFTNYSRKMNEHGVTTVKEMGFDTYSGFTEILHDLDDAKSLTLRVDFMSQPVAYKQNLKYGERESKRNSEMVRFSGYNYMTDGSVSEFCADTKQPYENGNICKQKIDYAKIEKDTLEADKKGFRVSLHAQGDAAIHKSIEIFDKCRKDEDGSLVVRHSMTDLELSDSSDFTKMAKLGIVGEVYSEIMSIYDDPLGKIELINNYVGKNRAKNYWNRRSMIDNKIVLCCATDLPLIEDNLGKSIRNSVFGRFNDGTLFQEQNTFKLNELLTAWTWGGAYNLGLENRIGSISSGFEADIVIWNCDLAKCDWEDTEKINVEQSLLKGKRVF